MRSSLRPRAALVAALALQCGAPTAHALAPRATGPADVLPSGILAVADARGPRHVLVAEKASQSLYVYEFDRRRATLVRVFPCTTGKLAGDKEREGDLRTPEGVYWFCRRIPGSQLPALYGAGALVMDYPNQFDRLDGKTGSGIWLHGVESDARASVANDTRGCVAVRNDHFAQLRRMVRLNDTPILIVDRLEMRRPEELAHEARAIDDLVESWRRAWESKDIDGYMAFYGPEFRASGMDRRAWERHKRDVAASESSRAIEVRDVDILREKDRVWVTFRQDYASDSHRDVGAKTLYLRGQGAEWRIVGESWRRLDATEPAAMVAALAPEDQRTPTGVAVAAADAGASPAALAPAPIEPSPEMPARVASVEAPSPAAPASSSADETPETTAPAVAHPSIPEPAVAVVVPPPSVGRPPALDPASPAVAPGTPRVARGPFRLASAHAQRAGGGVSVLAQLLSATPSTTRSGTIVVALGAAGGARELLRERFTVRQGRDVQVVVPADALPATITVLVLDEGGRVLLDQDIAVSGSDEHDGAQPRA